jgi:hypothetical protein
LIKRPSRDAKAIYHSDNEVAIAIGIIVSAKAKNIHHVLSKIPNHVSNFLCKVISCQNDCNECFFMRYMIATIVDTILKNHIVNKGSFILAENPTTKLEIHSNRAANIANNTHASNQERLVK